MNGPENVYAAQLMSTLDEATRTVTKTIASRLIGCDLSLISIYIRNGKLSVLPNDRLLLSEVEDVAGRPIKPREVEMCQAEAQYKAQYLANEKRLRLEIEGMANRIEAYRRGDLIEEFE